MPGALLAALILGGWTAEVPLAPLGPPAAAPGERYAVTAAGWGGDALVAWEDVRFGGLPAVLVSQVLADGGLSQPYGMLASTWGAKKAHVATFGSVAAVVWEQHEDVYLRLLQRDGQWLTPALRLGDGRSPDVALGPQGGVVVFEAGRLGAVRFGLDGSLADPVALPLSAAAVPWGTAARVAADPTDSYLVAWRDGSGALSHVTLTATGTTATAPMLLDTGTPSGALEVVALGPGHWFVTARWSLAATQVHLAGYDLGPLPGGSVTVLPDAQWKGLDVSNCDQGLCLLARSGTTSTTLTTATMPLDGGGAVANPAVAAQTNEWDLTCSADGTTLWWANIGQYRVRAQAASTSFLPQGPELILSDAPAGHLTPRAAAFGDTVLVAWIQPTATGSMALARRFDADGAALGTSVVQLGGLSPRVNDLRVRTTPTGWVVGLLDSNTETISLVAVAADGTVGTERRLQTKGAAFGLAVDDTRVLLAVKHFTTPAWDPILITVEPDGGETTLPVQSTPPKEETPSLAVSGTGERLVVFRDVDPTGASGSVIVGVRVSPSGQVLDSTGFRISPSSRTALNPEVVSDGDAGFIVVWESYTQVYAQHVAGTVASPPLTVGPTTAGFEPVTHHQVLPAPGGAVVVYANLSDGTAVARELTLDAAGLDAGRVAVVSTAGLNAWPTAAQGPSVAWFGYSSAVASQNAMQGHLHTFVREPEGVACEASWQCRSSVCLADRCGPDPQPADGGTGGPRLLTVGCDCSSSPAWWLPGFLLPLALRRRRPPRNLRSS